MIVLTKEQVVEMHNQLVAETGGISGIRDEGLLESAVNAPFQKFGGVDLFPSIQQKAARLGYGLIKNHAFLDGNKRIGTHTMLVFLALNGIELEYTQEELYTVILSVASSKVDLAELNEWIITHQL
ncbi:type II toxin-antitoxin system death-on-curing family toxin [Ruminococcus sp.]|uniref:type II toxin-antitoxin system death-on-curing family toxin n=1 Tax=Ruminococcus sp. TaxID=41978 RepID=UPI00386D4FB4